MIRYRRLDRLVDDPSPTTAPYTLYFPRRESCWTHITECDTLEEVVWELHDMVLTNRLKLGWEVAFYFGTSHFEGETIGAVLPALKKYAADGRTYRHFTQENT